MDKFHKSFELKLIAICLIALVVVIGAVHVAVYVTTKNIITEDITLSAKGIAVTVAAYVMDDIEGYKSFIAEVEKQNLFDPKIGIPAESYQNSAYYQKIQTCFSDIKKYSNVKFLYTERRLNAESVEFILDADPIGSEHHSAPRSVYKNDRWKERCYSTKSPTGYPPGLYDEWGELLGVYAPILDRDRKTLLGIVGVDINTAHFYRQLRVLQLTMFGVYAFILVAAVPLLRSYSGTFLDMLLKDKLTGAYTKRYCDRILQEEITHALNRRKDLAVLMLDLDYFKKVNDTYGHGFGDNVLVSISAVVKNALRQNDHFVRYGGEEFVVVIPNANEKRAMEIAERIRSAVQANVIHNEEKGISIKITISIGIALLSGPGTSPQNLIENADKALYESKKTRNCVTLFK